MSVLNDYLETYHEIALHIESYYDSEESNSLLSDLFEGKGQRWEKAKEWTDEFLKTHSETNWDEIDWFDTLDSFVVLKIKEFADIKK